MYTWQEEESAQLKGNRRRLSGARVDDLQCGLALARADKLPTNFDAQAKRIVLIVRLNYNS